MADFTTTLFSSLNIQTVLLGFVVLLIIQRFKQRLQYKLPPGPFALPFIGNYEVAGAKFTHQIFLEYRKKYGPVFQVYLGPIRAVVLNDIKLVTESLIERKTDFADRPQSPLTTLLSEGGKNIGFANYSPYWKLQKKIAGKAMRQYMAGNHLQNVLHKSMTKCMELMSDESGPFDPVKYTDLMVFNIFYAVLFGESAALNDPDFQQIIKLNREANDIFFQVLAENMLPILVKIRPTARYRRAQKWVNELTGFFRKKFQHHQQTFDQGHLRDLADALILAFREARKEENEEHLSKMTDTHLILTLVDIFMAGVDNSRHTIHFALRYMASLPHIQSKVQEEIDEIVGKDRLPGLNDRESLQYGEATLLEVMRLGMVSPTGVPHVTSCDTKVGGYDIPKDTMVIINHWALHRDADYWKDAEKFDPTRYLDENGKLTSKPKSWLPFSMGHRACLGETVAKAELHLIFFSILQRFNIRLAEETKQQIEYDGNSFVMRPASFKIVVEERE